MRSVLVGRKAAFALGLVLRAVATSAISGAAVFAWQVSIAPVPGSEVGREWSTIQGLLKFKWVMPGERHAG